MSSKYFEKGEYYVSEKEIVNGTVTRDYEDSEQWSSRGPAPPTLAIGRGSIRNGHSSASHAPLMAGQPYKSPAPTRRIEPGREWDSSIWTESRLRDRDFWDDDPKDPWASRFSVSEPFPARGRSQSRTSFQDRGFEETRRSKSIDRNYRESPRDIYPRRDSQDYTYSRDAPYYSVQSKDRLSDHGSRHELRHTSQQDAVSRPGSPGPVAGAGDIVNTDHGFSISLDVKHFQPQDIKVVLTGDTLTVTGERTEDAGGGQTLRRSFQRKYSMPADIRLDSVVSHLTDNGFLVINGSRKGWRETQISMHPVEGGRYQRGSSIISNV